MKRASSFLDKNPFGRDTSTKAHEACQGVAGQGLRTGRVKRMRAPRRKLDQGAGEDPRTGRVERMRAPRRSR